MPTIPPTQAKFYVLGENIIPVSEIPEEKPEEEIKPAKSVTWDDENLVRLERLQEVDRARGVKVRGT